MTKQVLTEPNLLYTLTHLDYADKGSIPSRERATTNICTGTGRLHFKARHYVKPFTDSLSATEATKSYFHRGGGSEVEQTRCNLRHLSAATTQPTTYKTKQM